MVGAMARDPVLSFTPAGIYCPDGGFYIDPWQPVDRAVITHGHADHAHPGHVHYLATAEAAPVLRHRLGDITLEETAYGTRHRIGGVTVSLHPAGHIPGSAQIRVERAGEVWVVSGDYKLEEDGLSAPFAPVRCHHFITESTFGLPAFHWPDPGGVAQEINAWWRDCQAEGRTPLLGAYSLGKAQRILRGLDPAIGPILTHGAVAATNDVLRAQGLELPADIPVTPEMRASDHPGALVLAPPAALGSAWAKRFGPVSTGFASGWMQLRGVRRRRAVDRGFILSDHADWAGLNRAVRDSGAETIHVTHGYTEVFARWVRDLGLEARIVPTQFDGSGDEDSTE